MPTMSTAVQYPDPDDAPLIPNEMALSSNDGIADEPTTSHTRTGENEAKIWVWATLPLVLHFTTIVTLLSVLITYIDGNDFNLHSRHALSTFTPLQSDITTAISSGIAIYRFFATMWSAATLWRCVFILMGKGGISLGQIDSLLTWQIHTAHPRGLKSSQVFGFLVSIILLAAFPSQLSGPILTGSVTWSSSHRFTEGQRVSVMDSDPRIGSWLSRYSTIAYERGRTLAPGFASTAWQGSEAERTMKRVIRNISHLPINSTLNNVTLPYFAVSKLEWIPGKEVPQMVTQSLTNDSKQNPFMGGVGGTFALIPDSWEGPHLPPYVRKISETRIIAGFHGNPHDACSTHYSPLFGDLPANVDSDYSSCLIYGRVTYVAGAATCWDCRVSSWVTVQNDTALTVSPSDETWVAVDIMPMVGAMMALQNNSLPRAYDNLDGYVTELLIRSYAAAWIFSKWLLSTEYPAESISLSTGVQVAVQTSRADVLWWRVWVWLSLNLLFTLSGLLFLFLQTLSGQQLVENPPVAALLLDTSELLHKRDRAFCNFSTIAEDDKDIGYLRFTRNWAQGGDHHQQVEMVEGDMVFPGVGQVDDKGKVIPIPFASTLRSSSDIFRSRHRQIRLCRRRAHVRMRRRWKMLQRRRV